MLVLTREVDQDITIGDDITIKVISIRGDQVRIGIQCPREIPILRPEAKVRTPPPDGGGRKCRRRP